MKHIITSILTGVLLLSTVSFAISEDGSLLKTDLEKANSLPDISKECNIENYIDYVMVMPSEEKSSDYPFYDKFYYKNKGCNLIHAKLQDTYLREANLIRADLRGLSWLRLT